MKLCALVLVALSACSSDVRRASQAIIGGTNDTVHTGVVAIGVTPTLQSGVGFCSGFLIAPNLVMTARHCVSDDTPPGSGTRCEDRPDGDGGMLLATKTGPSVPPNSFAITNEQDATNPTSFTDVKEVLVPPGTTSGAIHCGNDVALLWLKGPIDGAVPIAPRLDTPPMPGEMLTVSGYGYNGADTTSNGIRRTLSGSKVVSVGEVRSSGVLRAVANDWIIDRGPCGGDSGSPAIDENGLAIGVMSRGQPTVCQNMIYNQIQPFAEWLTESARKTATQDGIPIPAWAAPPPMPDAATPVDAMPPAKDAPKSGCNTAANTRGSFALILAILCALRKRRA